MSEQLIVSSSSPQEETQRIVVEKSNVDGGIQTSPISIEHIARELNAADAQTIELFMQLLGGHY
ncbi:hypothetical protein C5B42_05785 [Candidatus Cerribacteria bacterium 'Amazon FNV 2010 28 9']|uniref:Uncharacterized protein n=1 Tax=Candidatus Cerribacteria bacterium 'Amazon FNV 2010 28 9' TaxID=2081795 RepID=A0A317JLP1_9BACT|nr:MAG: hypothetical protein C5B42_05785 [Candidatus Cerribacteria bacterium 'Amazon FNV 2010 28 9']